jgi:hypothetical protein
MRRAVVLIPMVFVLAGCGGTHNTKVFTVTDDMPVMLEGCSDAPAGTVTDANARKKVRELEARERPCLEREQKRRQATIAKRAQKQCPAGQWLKVEMPQGNVECIPEAKARAINPDVKAG